MSYYEESRTVYRVIKKSCGVAHKDLPTLEEAESHIQEYLDGDNEYYSNAAKEFYILKVVIEITPV